MTARPGHERQPHDDDPDNPVNPVDPVNGVDGAGGADGEGVFSRQGPRDHEVPRDHEGPHDHEGSDGRGGQEGYVGMDALMAAVLDVRPGDLPEEARADSAYLAAHRSATADVALLREQLGVLADVLTEPSPESEPHPAPVSVRGRAQATAPAPVRRPRPPRRVRPLALRVAGVAAAGALVLGGGWVVLQAGRAGLDSSKSADSGAASDERSAASAEGDTSLLGDPHYLACARLVVEGDVTAAERVAGTTRERVTLLVTRSYLPAGSGPEVDFVMEEDMDPLLAKGDHVLVALSKGAATPDVWAVGELDIAPEREALSRALPEAKGISCE
ncbi:hypothetical protein ACIBAH_04775 [Streptomyces sp. NPDC051445]|uniref:hypothetical protein n=1 Tax=Streptomyces sp. NPDC051445 TaxID=3365653 RepID=UPI0037A86DFB